MNPSVPNTSFATPQKENNDADKRTQAGDAVEEKSKSADVVYPPGTVFIEVMGLHVAKGDYNTWTDPLLMQECKRRNIRGFSRGRKDTRIGMLFAWDANFKIMENENFVLDTPPTSQQGNMVPAQQVAKKTKHCAFRLMNVMFHDKHFEGFQKLYQNPSRANLDDPLNNESVKWWKVIHYAMSNPDSEYNNLVATMEQFQGHDPANISPNPLSPAQLLEMFEKIRDQYAVTYAKWDKSGEHNPNFWDYCGGRVDVLYLHCWTQQRAGLLQFVSKQAPKEAQFDSGRDALSQLIPTEKATNSTNIRKSSRKHLANTPPSPDQDENSISVSLKRMADSREDLTKRAKYDSVINNLQIALRNEREAKQIGDDRALAIWSVEVDFLLEQKKKKLPQTCNGLHTKQTLFTMPKCYIVVLSDLKYVVSLIQINEWSLKSNVFSPPLCVRYCRLATN